VVFCNFIFFDCCLAKDDKFIQLNILYDDMKIRLRGRAAGIAYIYNGIFGAIFGLLLIAIKHVGWICYGIVFIICIYFIIKGIVVLIQGH
jgi:hypothetical protein